MRTAIGAHGGEFGGAGAFEQEGAAFVECHRLYMVSGGAIAAVWQQISTSGQLSLSGSGIGKLLASPLCVSQRSR